MNLYKINQNLLSILNQEDINESEFLALSEQFNEKVENLVWYIRQQEIQAEAVISEIQRLVNIGESYSQEATRKKTFLDNILKNQWIEKLDLTTCKLSYRASSSVEITDESQIPDSFIKTKEVKSIDKIALKDAIKEIWQVPWATIVEKKSLQIK